MIIDYKKLEEYLKKLTTDKYAPVYLIYGENQLFKRSLNKLIEKIVPENGKELSCEHINCSEPFDIFEVISKLSAYSMFSAKKIIVLGEINLLGAGESQNDIKQDSDTESILTDFIAKGFCKGNHFIITAETIDKRKKLFKAINNAGVIIDCFISKGTNYADKKIQDQTLLDVADNILSNMGKKLTKEAYKNLYGLTGFDLATFSDHLKKLIIFTADKAEITAADVKALVNRTKKDPIYELTNAISEKDVKSALFYIDSLLNSGFHTLQILMAIINQVRKLLIVKNFIQENKTVWKTGLTYNQFQKSVMPAITDYDQKLYQAFLQIDPNTEDKKKSSLSIAQNRAYPAYQIFMKSDNFTIEELIKAFEYLTGLDFNLKSRSSNPKIMLQQTIISLFSKTR
ncbi:MAG: DNA polymerase III subunit delta [Deltaproteobacteria bacterium]|nr:DNA polymerase III subunit delta [Deltaproteobacteria bacterium]